MALMAFLYVNLGVSTLEQSDEFLERHESIQETNALFTGIYFDSGNRVIVSRNNVTVSRNAW